MWSALLLLQLASVDGVGSGPPASSEVSREAPRLHAGVHFAITGAFSGAAPGFGPGISTELGATFADRYALSARLTVGTIVVLTVATVGLAFDLALSDRLSLGLAASIGVVGGVFVQDMPGSVTVFAPLRVVYAPFARQPQQVGRTGLVLFAEAGPGYGLRMSSGLPGPGPARVLSPLSAQAGIGVGYAWW